MHNTFCLFWLFSFPDTPLWEKVFFPQCSCGWCDPSKPATLLRCPCLSVWPAHCSTSHSLCPFWGPVPLNPNNSSTCFARAGNALDHLKLCYCQPNWLPNLWTLPHMPALQFFFFYFSFFLSLWVSNCANVWVGWGESEKGRLCGWWYWAY